jgi:hypothetical protein
MNDINHNRAKDGRSEGMNEPLDQEYIDECVQEGAQSPLERMHIEEYLKSKGYDMKSVRELPEAEMKELMRQACTYASNKLAEVEARAQFRKEIRTPQ